MARLSSMIRLSSRLSVAVSSKRWVTVFSSLYCSSSSGSKSPRCIDLDSGEDTLRTSISCSNSVVSCCSERFCANIALVWASVLRTRSWT